MMRGKRDVFADALYRIMLKGGEDAAYKKTSKGSVWALYSSKVIDKVW